MLPSRTVILNGSCITLRARLESILDRRCSSAVEMATVPLQHRDRGGRIERQRSPRRGVGPEVPAPGLTLVDHAVGDRGLRRRGPREPPSEVGRDAGGRLVGADRDQPARMRTVAHRRAHERPEPRPFLIEGITGLAELASGLLGAGSGDVPAPPRSPHVALERADALLEHDVGITQGGVGLDERILIVDRPGQLRLEVVGSVPLPDAVRGERGDEDQREHTGDDGADHAPSARSFRLGDDDEILLTPARLDRAGRGRRILLQWSSRRGPHGEAPSLRVGR
jgi:hypothetical protein